MQPKNPDDKQYEDWGVVPPSREAHGTEQEVAANLASPMQHGDWTQQGGWIECHKCPFAHGHAIPTEYLLQGTDDQGKPILTKLI